MTPKAGLLLVVVVALMVLPPVQASTNSQDKQTPPRTAEVIRDLYDRSPEQNSWLPVSDNRAQESRVPALPSGSPPAWSRLAFESYRNNNWDIYLVNSDGSGELRLTTESSVEASPSLARGASQVLFVSKRDGNYEIYRSNANGSGLQRLTNHPSTDSEPRWSPDGARLAFQSTRSGNADVFVMNADGSGVVQLTNTSAYDGEPSWSPDGSQLVFVSQRTGRYELWIMNANGTNQRQLTAGATAFDPSWSPIGNQIAFSNDSNADGWLELWLVNSDGSGLGLLYPSGYYLDRHAPAWSPDGKWLAYIETDWIYYQGNWYWTTSNLRLREVADPYGASWGLVSDDRIWSVDWASTDITPPSACTMTTPNQQKRWSSFVISWTAQDNGPAGVAGYDVQTRQPNSSWVDVVTNATTTSMMFQGVESGVVELRCRARDGAGNVAAWAVAPVISVSIDAVRPKSQIVTERVVAGTATSLSWSGADSGSGIASYDVFVRDGTAGNWIPWLQDATTTTSTFYGQIGHTYFFQSQAKDHIGHKEPWRPAPKAAVTFYTQRLAGTIHDNRGVVAIATTEVQPAAVYSTTNEVIGDYGLYLGASSGYTLTAHGNGYGIFPMTSLTITSDTQFDIVLPPTTNAVTNGGFEAGTAEGWLSSGASISVTPASRYAGHYALQFNPTTTDTLEASQLITIDASLHQPTLSFLYHVPVALGGSLIVNVTGITPTEVLSTSAVTNGWQHAWFDLSAYSGQVVTITFRLSGALETVGIDEVTVGSWVTPQILDVSPTEWLGQATALFITGTNFISTPIVFLGTTPLTDVHWISPTQLEVGVPGGVSRGQYPVHLINPGGAATQWSGSLAARWYATWLPLIFNTNKDAPMQETTDWLTLGGDPGRTGHRRLETGASRYALAWSTTLPYTGGRPLAQIAAADGVVVASSDSYFGATAVVALDADSGQELWRYEFSNKYSLNPPAIGHGAVYVQEGNHSSDSYLFCLDLYTGYKNWQAPFAAQWYSYLAPLIVGQGVYVNGGYYGGLYGFDAGTGAQLWYAPLAQYADWTPTYANGKLYSWVAGNFQEHALSTGEVLWGVSADWSWSGYSMYTAPVVDQRTGLVASSAAVSAIDLDSRSVRWANSGNYYMTVPATADGVVYAIKDHVLEARRLTDGALLWTFAGDSGLVHAPIVAGKYVYVASDANTYVLDRETHAPVWQVGQGGWLTVANGYLYIAQASKTIYAYLAQEP